MKKTKHNQSTKETPIFIENFHLLKDQHIHNLSPEIEYDNKIIELEPYLSQNNDFSLTHDQDVIVNFFQISLIRNSNLSMQVNFKFSKHLQTTNKIYYNLSKKQVFNEKWNKFEIEPFILNHNYSLLINNLEFGNDYILTFKLHPNDRIHRQLPLFSYPKG